jgi:hypothetical protein
VDSQVKVDELLEQGVLEKLYLLPPEFGGPDAPGNVCYVPAWAAEMKSKIDHDIIRPRVAAGEFTQYTAKPVYEGKSFVPIAIDISSGPKANPGQFAGRVSVWGAALKSTNTMR